MPKYKFIYNVCEGIFQMDIFTGISILADNQTKASNAAARLDEIVSDYYKFRSTFELTPQPHIAVNCIKLSNGEDLNPTILRYQIQKSYTSENRILGFPVFSDNDFEDVSEDYFLDKFKSYYFDKLKTITKTSIRFEAISYEVQEEISM